MHTNPNTLPFTPEGLEDIDALGNKIIAEHEAGTGEPFGVEYLRGVARSSNLGNLACIHEIWSGEIDDETGPEDVSSVVGTPNEISYLN